MGRNTITGELVVLKYWNSASHRIDIECEALTRLKGCPGVVQLLDDARDVHSNQRVLVLEHIEGSLFPIISVNAPTFIPNYFRQLIEVLP